MQYYSEQIKYQMYRTGKTDFRQMVDDLLAQLATDRPVLRLVFFGAPATNQEYMMQHTILREKVQARYATHLPVLSYVAQPPLNASLIVEVHSLVPEADDRITYRTYNGIPYTLLENNYGRFLYAGGLQSDILYKDIETQSKEVFERIEGMLAENQFPINSIIRQWNYLEQITGFQGPHQNYQSFNNARGAFYEKTVWPKGYPAATGIGATAGGVLVDLDAVVFTAPDAFATPINNKLQIAAHAYSAHVLKKAQEQKMTPKFERAKSMTFGQRRLVYISGTAAIRGEDSLHGVGLAKQLHTTLENMAQLTGDAELRMLRVYLKHPADYQQTAELMRQYRLSIPISYLCADVCRDELLIEIEGVAVE